MAIHTLRSDAHLKLLELGAKSSPETSMRSKDIEPAVKGMAFKDVVKRESPPPTRSTTEFASPSSRERERHENSNHSRFERTATHKRDERESRISTHASREDNQQARRFDTTKTSRPDDDSRKRHLDGKRAADTKDNRGKEQEASTVTSSPAHSTNTQDVSQEPVLLNLELPMGQDFDAKGTPEGNVDTASILLPEFAPVPVTTLTPLVPVHASEEAASAIAAREGSLTPRLDKEREGASLEALRSGDMASIAEIEYASQRSQDYSIIATVEKHPTPQPAIARATLLQTQNPITMHQDEGEAHLEAHSAIEDTAHELNLRTSNTVNAVSARGQNTESAAENASEEPLTTTPSAFAKTAAAEHSETTHLSTQKLEPKEQLVKDAHIQIARDFQEAVHMRKSQFEIKLNPEGLGRVHIQLNFDKKLVETHFTVDPASLPYFQKHAQAITAIFEAHGFHSEQNGLTFSLHHNGTQQNPQSGFAFETSPLPFQLNESAAAPTHERRATGTPLPFNPLGTFALDV